MLELDPGLRLIEETLVMVVKQRWFTPAGDWTHYLQGPCPLSATE